VFKPPTKELNKQTIGNICLKINAKLGVSKPALLKRPVMVMGADKPSIAAIVGSVEPKAANYQVELRVQDGAQNEEVIHDMKNVTNNLLIHDENKGRKPEKIVMYRDGVSVENTQGPFPRICTR
jgi:hypothetical protein